MVHIHILSNGQKRPHTYLFAPWPDFLKNHTACAANVQPRTTTQTEIHYVVAHTQLDFEGSQVRVSSTLNLLLAISLHYIQLWSTSWSSWTSAVESHSAKDRQRSSAATIPISTIWKQSRYSIICANLLFSYHDSLFKLKSSVIQPKWMALDS